MAPVTSEMPNHTEISRVGVAWDISEKGSFTGFIVWIEVKDEFSNRCSEVFTDSP